MRWDNYPALYVKMAAEMAAIFAERVGFKPTVRQGRTPDFESGPFDHSGIFPDSGCKDNAFSASLPKTGKKNRGFLNLPTVPG